VRELVRQNRRFFLWATLAGLGLRLLFFFWMPRVTTDSLFYGDLAKNWLQHGIYAYTDNDQILPTFARLPGYPGFLAIIFAIFGVGSFKPALVVQILVDLGTCFVVADLARRTISPRAAKAAFLLTALCPFLANYSAAALTETFEIFFTALALDFVVIGFDHLESARVWPWIGCGGAIALCTLFRPDGGILLLSIGAYMGILLLRDVRSGKSSVPVVRAGLLVAAVALAPLGVWGLRNHHTLHQWEFLAPRYANYEGEFVPTGFNRWIKTWIADYVSTEEVYWNIPGDKVDPHNLPSRTYDTRAQKERVFALFDQYNDELHITPEMDAQFAAMAEERIQTRPLRYYAWLPLVRITDMWMRPRTELLPPDSRWYAFTDDLKWLALSLGLGLINLLYVAGAFAGFVRHWRSIAWVGLAVIFILLRSFFLGTMENPEARYTLESFPAVIWLASALWMSVQGSEPVSDGF
jgi:4-amino-4-deoxy-L-arabinose transferase-like glycosyltransferase